MNGRYVTGRLQWYQCRMQASSLGWYLHGQPAPLLLWNMFGKDQLLRLALWNRVWPHTHAHSFLMLETSSLAHTYTSCYARDIFSCTHTHILLFTLETSSLAQTHILHAMLQIFCVAHATRTHTSCVAMYIYIYIYIFSCTYPHTWSYAP